VEQLSANLKRVKPQGRRRVMHHMNKPKFRRLMREHVVPLAIIVLVLTSFRSAIADWNIVPTGSMNPSIIEGDRIFVNKLAYGLKVPFTTWHLAHWDAPERGEIVVFNSPTDGTRLVKRVVGLPGDTIEMRNEILFINGERVNYQFVTPSTIDEQLDGRTHPILINPAVRAMRSFGPVKVPAEHYFMLGDNRDNSGDSRYVGFVPRDSIVGRSSRVVLSFDPETHLPRVERTLHALP
jgi:signal peptidase I